MKYQTEYERSLDNNTVREVYRKRAPRYNITSRLYELLGYRLDAYRKAGIDGLQLRPGDTVVELGCGTGANFPHLVHAVGSAGKVIGVDLTDAMLDQARARITSEGWNNVDLVQSDMAAYQFLDHVDGVISTYALGLCADYDDVLRRAALALRPAGRMAIVDIKAPQNWSPWLLRAILPLVRPFAVTLELAERHPWESVARYCETTLVRQFYLGTTYVAVGTVGTDRPHQPQNLDS